MGNVSDGAWPVLLNPRHLHKRVFHRRLCLSQWAVFHISSVFQGGCVSHEAQSLQMKASRVGRGKQGQSRAVHCTVFRLLTQAFLSETFYHPWQRWVKNPRYWLCLVSNLPVLVSSLPWSWKQACYCSPQDLPQPSQSSRKPPYSLKKTQVFLLLCFHWAVGITAAKLLRFGLPLPAMSFAGNQGKTTGPQIIEGGWMDGCSLWWLGWGWGGLWPTTA